MRSGSKALMRSAAALAAALFLNAQAHAASILREATIGEPPPLTRLASEALHHADVVERLRPISKRLQKLYAS